MFCFALWVATLGIRIAFLQSPRIVFFLRSKRSEMVIWTCWNPWTKLKCMKLIHFFVSNANAEDFICIFLFIITKRYYKSNFILPTFCSVQTNPGHEGVQFAESSMPIAPILHAAQFNFDIIRQKCQFRSKTDTSSIQAKIHCFSYCLPIIGFPIFPLIRSFKKKTHHKLDCTT